MAKRKSASTSTGNGGAAEHVVETRVAEEAVVAAAFDKFSKEVGSGGEQVFELDPDNILIDPAIKSLRRWDGTSQQELRIPELARTIGEEGQIEPCIVRETEDGYVLVAGHRRHAAVTLLREGGEWSDTMLKVIVRKMDEETALRNAMIENVQSEDFTGIEFGALCVRLRERYKAAGWDKKGSGTALVAGYLGVSPATVTTHEKLLQLPVGVQDDVQSGRLSVNAALELSGVADEARPDVLDKAKQLADKDAEKRRVNEEKRQKIAQDRVSGKNKHAAGEKKATSKTEREEASETDPEPERPLDTPAAPQKPATPAKVTGKHIRQAAKSVQGEKARVKAPKMGEAIDAFEGWISALYPAVCVEFSKAFSAWGHGKMTDAALTKAWDAIADRVRTINGEFKEVVKKGMAPLIKKTKPARKQTPKPKSGKTPVAVVKKGGKPAKKKGKK